MTPQAIRSMLMMLSPNMVTLASVTAEQHVLALYLIQSLARIVSLLWWHFCMSAREWGWVYMNDESSDLSPALVVTWSEEGAILRCRIAGDIPANAESICVSACALLQQDIALEDWAKSRIIVTKRTKLKWLQGKVTKTCSFPASQRTQRNITGRERSSRAARMIPKEHRTSLSIRAVKDIGHSSPTDSNIPSPEDMSRTTRNPEDMIRAHGNRAVMTPGSPGFRIGRILPPPGGARHRAVGGRAEMRSGALIRGAAAGSSGKKNDRVLGKTGRASKSGAKIVEATRATNMVAGESMEVLQG